MTRRKAARWMGISTTTLRRKLRQHQIILPKGAIPPDTLIHVFTSLGYRELIQAAAPLNAP